MAALKAQSESRSNSVSDGNIRVDVGLLDKLMTRVGELVLARNQIVQYTSRLGDTSFISTAQRLNLITTELQESVMKTRMQPIGNVWAKFPRVVRDLSSQLGKQVRDRNGRQRDGAGQDHRRSDQGSAHAPGAQFGRPRHRVARSPSPGRQAGRRLPAAAGLSRRGPGQHRNHRRRRRARPRSNSQQGRRARAALRRPGGADDATATLRS